MIKNETLQKLQGLIGFDEMVKVVGMQAIMHSTKVTPSLIRKGGFTAAITAKFAVLLGEDQQSAARALAGVLACEEYDSRCSFQGLGGCVVIPLETLLKRHQDSAVEEGADTAQDEAPVLRERGGRGG